MVRGLKTVLVATLAAILVGVGAAGAQAQNTTHGCACIPNNTKATISYRYKWGEQQWQNFKLQPNYQNWICWKYADAAKSSPALSFQLDVDMTKGNAWTTFSLPRMQSTAATCQATPKACRSCAWKRCCRIAPSPQRSTPASRNALKTERPVISSMSAMTLR